MRFDHFVTFALFVLVGAIIYAETQRPTATEQRVAEATNAAELAQIQKEQKPVLITTHGDLQVWKIKDVTPGGSRYVYYTTRGDTLVEETCGKGCTTVVPVLAPR